jgi:hypothetical protein
MANIITKTFTYNLPDDYLSQERTLGKTAEWTYIGPDEICLVVEKTTNKYSGQFLTHDHDKDNTPVPLDKYHVHVSCEDNPLLCALAHAEIEKPDYADLDQHEELLPDGLTYKRPLHPPPDHTHDISDIVFDPVTESAPGPYPWKKPHSNWDQLRNWRTMNLFLTDYHEGEHLESMPESLRTQWAEYRQKLRDLPQTHGATNIHVLLDLTAAAPFNTVGHALLKMTDVTGINVGDDVGVRGWPVVNIFEDHTRVIGVNAQTKVVELDKALIVTPDESNSDLAFSPCPGTEAHKIGAHTTPDGKGGVDGDLGAGAIGYRPTGWNTPV